MNKQPRTRKGEREMKEYTTEWGTFEIPADVVEMFAEKDTPGKVGHLASKLLDTTDIKASVIEAARQNRLEELRAGRSNDRSDNYAADRIDRYARINRVGWNR